MPRVSVKRAAAAAVRDEAAARSKILSTVSSMPTVDSFQNFAHKLGVGTDSPLSGATYGFNPITRNRILLEWIHRGSWLGGVAVDVKADDMTRAGIEYVTELTPDAQERLDHVATSLNTWSIINEVCRWGSLYGGCLGVVMVDGQDMRTPLRLNTVGAGQFKGILVLDRWMVEPSLEDLVTDLGPHIGLPKYYRVTQAAPALRGVAVHHSRVAIRHCGIELPYQQKLVENLWGISVLERLYDRMVAFDSASTGAAQLVYKSYLRTMKIDGLRDVVAAGNQAMEGLVKYVDMMRRFQGIEGISLVDAKDEFDAQSHSSFSGLSDALTQFGQQLSGALQIPLVRLFGQSPAGLNSTGESDLRMYYDHINQLQMKLLYHGVTLIYKLIARSEQIELPPNFSLAFKNLWQLTDGDKANVAQTVSGAVSAALESGMITQKVALKELRQNSRVTGVFTNITKEMVDQADDQLQPPGAQDLLSSLTGGGGAEPPPGGVAPGQLPGINDGTHQEGAPGAKKPMDQGAGLRKRLQLSSAGGSQAGRPDRSGAGAGRPGLRPRPLTGGTA